jgi:circadian clock protein KaiB
MSRQMVFTVYVEGAEMGRVVSARLHQLCSERGVAADIRVVDVAAAPAAAEESNVVGVPTVVREIPRPRRRVIGALDDTRRVAEALGLDDEPSAPDPDGLVREESPMTGAADGWGT